MKKILIFGSTGMAGHVITRYFKSLNKYEIFNSSRSRLDEDTHIIDVLNNREDIINFIERLRPDIIINCIGVLIRESELYPDQAIYINSYFPRFLENLGKKSQFKLIHLSTDCVFSGERGNYSETDIKDGKTMYARTKSLGEVINKKDLTIRTSIIGPELKSRGEGLFHWFFNQKNEIKGYNKVYWTGITTLELAKAIDVAVEEDLSGLYHLVPNNKISKHELLNLIKKIWNLPIKIIKSDVPVSDKSLINTRTDFSYNIPDYEDMLRELHEWMKNYNYQYYKK
ncbi:MAG: dTDP-4-dehydrorhamnose reductase family protein [Promethearchaeota archaeon]